MFVQEADIQKMSAAEREDAVNEIRLLASIRHENICRYHEAFVDGNHLCIVMEFAPNGDLARFIRKGQEFKKVTDHLASGMPAAWKSSVQLGRAIHACHTMQAFPEDLIWKYLTGSPTACCLACMLPMSCKWIMRNKKWK
jgi:serine/threonine protein kinase